MNEHYENETDREWAEQEEAMNRFMDKIDGEQNMMKYFSHFANFPTKTKKDIFRNLGIIAGCTALVFWCVFGLKYKDPLLFLVYGAITLFLCWKIFATFFYLRHAHFITFTGVLTESYPVGSKVLGDKHFIFKIVAEDGRELCFPYYDSQQFYFDQEVTLFINNRARIEMSEWGPYVSQYIEMIPTKEIDAKVEFLHGGGRDISAKEYLD